MSSIHSPSPSDVYSRSPSGPNLEITCQNGSTHVGHMWNIHWLLLVLPRPAVVCIGEHSQCHVSYIPHPRQRYLHLSDQPSQSRVAGQFSIDEGLEVVCRERLLCKTHVRHMSRTCDTPGVPFRSAYPQLRTMCPRSWHEAWRRQKRDRASSSLKGSRRSCRCASLICAPRPWRPSPTETALHSMLHICCEYVTYV